MFQKFLCGLLSVLLVFSCSVVTFAIEVSSPSVILMEANSGEILFEKNSTESRSIASITKVMTLVLTMEALESSKLHLDDILTASEHASSMGGSDIWLKAGEKMSVNDLIKATVVMSANDAAVVLAEEIGGTHEAFVNMMNEKAKELGMEYTSFKNCNGLDTEGHLSCAKDVAIMSRELLKHEKIKDYTLTWIDYVRDGKTQLVNTNKLIKTYKGMTGLKTGTTSTAGSCITASASRDGLDLIAVVLGASDTKTRFSDAEALLNYGFSNWSIANPEVEIPEEIDVKNAMEETCKIRMIGDTKILISQDQKNTLTVRTEIDEDITAPLVENQQIGKVKVYVGNELKKQLPIVSENEIEEINFPKVFMYFLSKFTF